MIYRHYRRRSSILDVALFAVEATTFVVETAAMVTIALSEKGYNERSRPIIDKAPPLHPLPPDVALLIEDEVSSIPAGQRQAARVKLQRQYSSELTPTESEANPPKWSSNLFNDFSDALKYGYRLHPDIKQLITQKVQGLSPKEEELTRMELFIHYSRLTPDQQLALLPQG